MATKTSRYKISRQIGAALWGEAKDPQNKKNYKPGQHGPSGRMQQLSDYGKQLRAKQTLRRYYNLAEKQFRKTFFKAANKKGDTGENLIGSLESRLDAFVYRSNFVPTIFAARQFVTHKHVLVNGKKTNIPSYTLKVGDVVEIKDSSRELPMVVQATQSAQREVPEYIKLEDKGLKATYVRVPGLEDVPYPVQIQPSLIIEYYSR